jgi:hypothetical protein
VVAVRWYLCYGLSYRDVEELLAERGIEVDHVTVYRWAQRFTPLLADAARFCRRSPGDRWFVDETQCAASRRGRPSRACATGCRDSHRHTAPCEGQDPRPHLGDKPAAEPPEDNENQHEGLTHVRRLSLAVGPGQAACLTDSRWSTTSTGRTKGSTTPGYSPRYPNQSPTPIRSPTLGYPPTGPPRRHPPRVQARPLTCLDGILGRYRGAPRHRGATATNLSLRGGRHPASGRCAAPATPWSVDPKCPACGRSSPDAC